ncbi:MAG TPA: hypothetical protein DDZ96_03795 [Porphyromonadaceae bacterium]|jgi:nitrogen regulatory protein PII|nr:hypothetical protein [Porphyromonadaceae bacterium]HBL32928.1 hypothetical protein [Porphyromonadaceae bacterium]
MINYSELSSHDDTYCILGIIVNRGQGKKIFQFARRIGFSKANCLLGEGRSSRSNRILEFLALDEVDKEVILLGVKSQQGQEMLSKLEKEFNFDKPNKGIAFMMPVSYPGTLDREYVPESPYVNVMIILNENVADDFGNFVQEHGFSGLTMIKARGAASIIHPLMGIQVESAKVVAMMIVPRSKMEHLIYLVSQRFNLATENTGVLAVQPISRLVGIVQDEKDDLSMNPSAPEPIIKQMVVALVPHGSAEEYLHNVKKLGVSGSTIIHSRLANLSPNSEGLLPIGIDAEEDMVITLASHELASKIRHELSRQTFENQVEKPYAFSFPVIRTEGIRAEGFGE